MGEGAQRLFVALPLPREVRVRLGRVQALLRARDLPLRPVPEGNLHCTLRFLGSLDPTATAAVRAALREAALPGAFEARCRGLGCFPRRGRRPPRVVWAGLDGPEGALGALHRAVEEAVVAAGMTRDASRFVPHVTLARVKGRMTRRDLSAAWRDVLDEDAGEVPVTRVVLYGSELTRGGSVYTPLEEVELPGR